MKGGITRSIIDSSYFIILLLLITSLPNVGLAQISPIGNTPLLSANDDHASTNEDTSVRIDVLRNDSHVGIGQPTITTVTRPASGSVNINSDNTVTYTPNKDFFGSDSFTYTVSDQTRLVSDSATVFVTVNSVPDLIVTQVQSGLVAFDPLNNETKTRQDLQAENGTYWTYGGSATNFNTPVDIFQDSQGFHIGVQAPADGTYAGYYAVTPKTDAQLFHAVITTPVRTIDKDFFQNGLYVQTGDGRINYVTCVSITSTAGTGWHLIRTFGDNNQALFFEVLWSDSRPNSEQPLTRDCTIVTNGDNYLKLYMDGIKVYESSNLILMMPGPFLYFLEPQNSRATMLYGIYNDYYATTNEMLKVTNLPAAAAKVQLLDANNNVLVETSAISNASATMDIGMLHFPVIASIKVLDSSGLELVSTSAPAKVYGGDVYSIATTP